MVTVPLCRFPLASSKRALRLSKSSSRGEAKGKMRATLRRRLRLMEEARGEIWIVRSDAPPAALETQNQRSKMLEARSLRRRYAEGKH